MECRYAYLMRNIDYVLCSKAPNPNPYDKVSVAHAVCPHQAHCPRENCHKLTASWTKCLKLAEANQRAYDEVFNDAVPAQGEAPKKAARRTRKPKAEE